MRIETGNHLQKEVLSKVLDNNCSLTRISLIHNPTDTERKLEVHKASRRRPGRLLNVLCTFNLRPVSTGQITLNIAKVYQID